MKYYQIDFHIIGEFYMQTAYDLETRNQREIKRYIAEMQGCKQSEIELMMDTLKSYTD